MSFPATAKFPTSQWDGSSASRSAAIDGEPVLEVYRAPSPDDWSQITAELRSVQIQLGAGGIAALSSTTGFAYAPKTAGTPSGTPAGTPTGFAPFLIDTTAGKLWTYYSGAWHYAAFT